MNEAYITSEGLVDYLEDVNFELENLLRKISLRPNEEEMLELREAIEKTYKEICMNACTEFLLRPYTTEYVH